jgi:hypothetical protein
MLDSETLVAIDVHVHVEQDSHGRWLRWGRQANSSSPASGNGTAHARQDQ